MIVNYRSKFEQIHSEFINKHSELVAAGRFDESRQLHNEYWEAVDWLYKHMYTEFELEALKALTQLRKERRFSVADSDPFRYVSAKAHFMKEIEDLMYRTETGEIKDAQS